MDACEAGAKLAHRWTKTIQGQSMSKHAHTPQSAADDTLRDWRSIWGEVAAQDWSGMQVESEALPRPPPSLIRAAAKTFPFFTALSGDFIHPRLVAWLDDGALEVLAEIFLLIEEVGVPPLELLTLVFIPKPSGGTRPIGLLLGLMRLWRRVRHEYAKT